MNYTIVEVPQCRFYIFFLSQYDPFGIGYENLCVANFIELWFGLYGFPAQPVVLIVCSIFESRLFLYLVKLGAERPHRLPICSQFVMIIVEDIYEILLKFLDIAFKLITSL